MYNPSRGGVRGGADQFTWESVKTDKHRENYLGHSLKAPVGRWQKGKDLSWYAKERKEENPTKAQKSELEAIKMAEEEAMLIALGHNIIRKESQTLTKEEISEALKRNIGERDELNIERVDGVGAISHRAALLSGTGKNSKQRNEGVTFETHNVKTANVKTEEEQPEFSPNSKMKKARKSSKKHKKEKKKKKHRKDSSDSEKPIDSKYRTKHKKHRRDSLDSEEDSDSKYKTKRKTLEPNIHEIDKSHSILIKKKKSKHKLRYSSESSSSEGGGLSHSKHRTYKKQQRVSDSASVKRRRHDTSESD